MDAQVRLVPMSPDAYERFYERLIREHAARKVAAGKVDAGNWLEEDSLEKAGFTRAPATSRRTW